MNWGTPKWFVATLRMRGGKSSKNDACLETRPHGLKSTTPLMILLEKDDILGSKGQFGGEWPRVASSGTWLAGT
jgi:hypothetical protein